MANKRSAVTKEALARALMAGLLTLLVSGAPVHSARAQDSNPQDNRARENNAQGTEQVQCVEGDGWLDCRAAAGDRLAMYRLGRDAYEQAGQDGDYTEALQMARKLAAEGDKNGKRLLKMVHLQLSWGHHKDNVQAYVWMVEDRNSGIDYLDKLINNLSDKMTPQQLAEAKQKAGQ